MLQTTERPMPMCRSDAGWRRQFSRPSGVLGWLLGHLMAMKNKERSLWVLSLMDLRPTDRVLEIGFGSGADIRRVAEGVAFVAGIDHSGEMVRQAARRNAQAIRSGKVEVRLGAASTLPYADNSFDSAFSINVAQLWDKPAETVAEIRRVLKPDGRVAIAVQPRNKGATEETANATGRKLVNALNAAGFISVRLERRALKPVSVVCALGLNRGS